MDRQDTDNKQLMQSDPLCIKISNNNNLLIRTSIAIDSYQENQSICLNSPQPELLSVLHKMEVTNAGCSDCSRLFSHPHHAGNQNQAA